MFFQRSPTSASISHKSRRWPAAAVEICVWTYLAAVAAAWALLRLGGDRWWFATVMLFGPRWIYALPWFALAPAAFFVQQKLLWPLAAAAVVLLGPIMGLCLPWARLGADHGRVVRVLTCNVNGEAVDGIRLAALLDDARPDVIALQECPSDLSWKWPEGWRVRRDGRLLVASPYPLRDVESTARRQPPNRWPPTNALRCIVQMPGGPVPFCCLHLLTPRDGLSIVLDRQTVVQPARSNELTEGIIQRRTESEETAAWLQQGSDAWIVAGDFNMPTDSAIYRDVWSNYLNAFSVAGFGFGYTKWTPVDGWQFGLRIDHVLATPGMKARGCWVGPDVGSDHLPLLAEIAMPRTAR